MDKKEVKELRAKIKQMENKKREESAPKVEPEAPMAFDSWYHQRKSKIAACHLKEIIMADFMARGLGIKETMAAYDAALELYGVKLK